MSIQQKYNTKAAALYRDKIATLAQGKSWSAETSSAASYSSSSLNADSHRSSSASSRNNTNGQRNTSAANSNSSRGYQDFDDDGGQGGYQNFNTTEFRDQKQQFFNRIQEENASRPE